MPGTPIAEFIVGPLFMEVERSRMTRFEYLLSLILAVFLVAGAAAWTQVTTDGEQTVGSCRDGRGPRPVFLKGMTIYPRCPGGKRG